MFGESLRGTRRHLAVPRVGPVLLRLLDCVTHTVAARVAHVEIGVVGVVNPSICERPPPRCQHTGGLWWGACTAPEATQPVGLSLNPTEAGGKSVLALEVAL